MGPVHREFGEHDGAGELGARLGTLVQTETAPPVHLDVVVEVPDQAEGHDGPDREVAGPRKPHLRVDVAGGVPQDGTGHDRDAAHGRRTRLDAVRGGTVLANVLADLAAPEISDEDRGEKNGDQQRDAARNEETEHAA